MIEKPPVLAKKKFEEVWKILINPDHDALFNKINNEYLYWDKIKYKIPTDVDSSAFWHAVKSKRNLTAKTLTFGKTIFKFTVTEKMQELLHTLDLNLGGSLGTQGIIPEKDKKFYLINSIMEEAIASSQIEGASTTRKVAKDMLRKQLKPKNKGQQMIYNNYVTIQYLVENQSKDFSVEQLKEIQRLITHNTLTNKEYEGSFRTSDDVMVIDGITGEIAHTPPSHQKVEQWITELCDFANNDNEEVFIHPIIKGIIIHFMLAYIHPFVDGNGRTARSLVYWYMIKKGYWLTEYLSISRIIYRNKKKYEMAFLYTENDENDLSYFIQYNLEVMHKAFEELKIYLQRKISEQNDLLYFKEISEINERQAQILKTLTEKPKSIFTAKELTSIFNVSIKTTRSDLQQLVALGFMQEININQRQFGYIRADNFEEKLEEIRGN
ncbi:MAG: Adenosine monophosphate-protein transferase SoFic [Bacteroidetes bacterium ADurb.Bin174]|mgnify:FL=1|nr:MAG: Adenosine monophosphate-protein transferase SoFic [Bacteroidetes bacterium ADurb.Bin174]